MQKTKLSISIILRGPLLTQSPSPGVIGLDAVVALNHNNQAYLPGSLISGKIRQSFEELESTLSEDEKPDWFAPRLNDWLGIEAADDFAKSKRLYFSDFILDTGMPDSSTRYRIKIDSERGSVAKSQIVMLESPFISGESYTFNGTVHFFSSPEYAESIQRHLHVAIKWFANLGALSSVGFGQVEKTAMTTNEHCTIPKPIVDASKVTEKLTFCIQAKYAFCLAGKPNSDNLFQSEYIIPGSAIKACIANTWNNLHDKQSGIMQEGSADFKELQESLSKIRISHAFPGHERNKRPVVAPLSIVSTTKGKGGDKKVLFYDVAQLSTPCLIDKQAPTFSVDWKNNNETLTGYPWPYIRFKNWGWEDKLQTELRVHTKIDRKTNRSAEGELFAYEQIIAEDKNWFGEINLAAIPPEKKAQVTAQLEALCCNGLIGLGKTKAPFDIKFSDNNEIKPAIPGKLNPENNNIWLITLQTDTLLGSPENLHEPSGKAELEGMYQKAWNEISGDKLKLLHYFARQRLSGGRFRQNTMQKATHYRPWLLTEAGSVFVLQGDDQPSITRLLNQWLAEGLPVSQSAIHWYQLGTDKAKHWQRTPFVPQNGYGEIAVNIQAEGVTQLQDTSSNDFKAIDLINNSKMENRNES